MKKLFFLASALLCGVISASAVDYLVQTGKEGDGKWTEDAIKALNVTTEKVIDLSKGGTLPTTGEIWFAAGTYDFTAQYAIQAKVVIRGGFAGTETTTTRALGESKKPYDFANATIFNAKPGEAAAVKIFPEQVGGLYIDGICIKNSAGTGDVAGVCRLASGSTVVNCIFEGCSSAKNGGVFVLYNANAKISNCLFKGNEAPQGGAMRIGSNAKGYSVTIENCDFISNKATGDGGAVFKANDDVSLSVKGCSFDGNTAAKGAALAINTTKCAIVSNSTFTNNIATTNGGALYLVGTDTITINGCKMFLNAAKQGSAIYDDASQVSVITNNVIYNNGAGIEISNMYPAVTHIKPLLFANNTICFNYGRVNVASNVAKAVVANNIVWGNKVQGSKSTAETPLFTSASFNFVNASEATGCAVSNNFTQNAIATNNNNKIVISNNVTIVEANMGFEAPTDTFGVVPAERTAKYEKVLNANFALTSGSEFIDQGIDLALVTTDILGTERVAGKYDVGAYEFVGGGVGSAFENTEKAPLDIQAALQAGEVYNLLGQRVGELQAGNIYIVGGQKVLMQ